MMRIKSRGPRPNSTLKLSINPSIMETHVLGRSLGV